MKYFSILPRITYKFSTGDYNVIDIFTKVALNRNFFDNTNLYYQEQSENILSPERLSFEKYQTFDYYWLLMLANNVYDVNRDWPANQEVFGDVLDEYSKFSSYFIYETAEIVKNDILYLSNESYGIIDSWNPFYKEITIKENYGLPTNNLSNYSFEIRRININGTFTKLSNYCDPRTTQFSIFGHKPYLEAPSKIQLGDGKILNPFLKIDGSVLSDSGELILDSCGDQQSDFQNTLIYKVVNNQIPLGVKVITNTERLLSEYVDKINLNIINPSIASRYEDIVKQLFNDPAATATTISRIG